ncbi:MFS transporter [Mycolicibacterium farcinogenes]|nr:MFS transporter [Mycolicibacterium farcinogenes]
MDRLARFVHRHRRGRLAWALIWVLYYRSPDRHPRVSDAELEHINSGRTTEIGSETKPLRWTSLIKNRNIMAVAFGFWCVTFVEYFFITWFPAYLVQERGFSLLKLGLLGSIPAITALIGQYVGGYTTDTLLRRGWSVTRARKSCIIAGCLLSSSIAFAGFADSAATALVLLSISTASIMFAVASIYCLCSDLSPRAHASQGQEGSIAGIVNGISNTAGIASPAIIGLILGVTGSFVGGLVLAGAIAILAVVIFALRTSTCGANDCSTVIRRRPAQQHVDNHSIEDTVAGRLREDAWRCRASGGSRIPLRQPCDPCCVPTTRRLVYVHSSPSRRSRPGRSTTV